MHIVRVSYVMHIVRVSYVCRLSALSSTAGGLSAVQIFSIITTYVYKQLSDADFNVLGA